MKRYDSTQQGAFAMVAEVLNCAPSALTLDSSIMTQSGWDSFSQIEIMVYLSEVYSINIDDDNIDKYSSLKNIVSLFEGS